MKNFKAEVDKHKKAKSGLYHVLKKICDAFALSHLSQEMKYLLEDSYMTPEHSKWVDSLLLEQCRVLREDVVSLVDSFGLPDLVLHSAIGRFDGNVYENYFAQVNSSKIQKLTDNGRPAYWEEVVKPLLQGTAF